MFAAIAPRYDLLNRLLSAGLDRRWRQRTADRVLEGLTGTGLQVLDVCCGTGDLAAELGRRPQVGRVVGADFAESMVRRAAEKAGRGGSRPRGAWMVGDAMGLPFHGPSFDVVTMAFGLRNLVDPAAGIRECARVLRPGGRLAVLEFFPPPRGLTQRLFQAYFHHVLPRIGRWISPSGRFDAYRYLPESVECFATPQVVRGWMEEAGLRATEPTLLTFGTVAVVTARLEAGADAAGPARTAEAVRASA